jgi:hypothetical protein
MQQKMLDTGNSCSHIGHVALQQTGSPGSDAVTKARSAP